MMQREWGGHLRGGSIRCGALQGSGDHVDAEVDAVHKHAVLGRHVKVPTACTLMRFLQRCFLGCEP